MKHFVVKMIWTDAIMNLVSEKKCQEDRDCKEEERKQESRQRPLRRSQPTISLKKLCHGGIDFLRGFKPARPIEFC
jgi:hypothetical protein